jgi:hypothetical protein
MGGKNFGRTHFSHHQQINFLPIIRIIPIPILSLLPIVAITIAIITNCLDTVED